MNETKKRDKFGCNSIGIHKPFYLHSFEWKKHVGTHESYVRSVFISIPSNKKNGRSGLSVQYFFDVVELVKSLNGREIIHIETEDFVTNLL